MRFMTAALALVISMPALSADAIQQTKGKFEDKFRQLEADLPTPNVYRTGSGAPGHMYWQQEVDYDIEVTLDEKNRHITGSAAVTYKNNSPDELRYLWLQMDQNRFSKHSDAYLTMKSSQERAEKMSMGAMRMIAEYESKDFGFKVGRVESGKGKALSYVVNDTMMRIDLPKPLKSGDTFEFEIDWEFDVVGGRIVGARGGYEEYERHGNDVYFIAQWFPRLAAYTDLKGWEHKQFLGTGEFTLEFGDYDVEITVPADHVVGSTGTLENAKDVLTKEQRDRWEEAKTSDRPVFIVTAEEALENEKEGTDETKTWHFKAEDVRDFAFASSRKFVWDAMGVKMPESDRVVMAQSLYPEEAMPLWDKYSTHSIAHTLETYSRYSIEYPYPVAWSVKGPIGGGMEYPMITSNGPMPVIHDDGERTYSRRAKYFLISVIIHEIGHIYFPMIINSDERNWAWMDEGLNSFLQSVSEREWEEYFPSSYGHPDKAISYMVSPNQTPIMTQSDSIIGYGPNAYTKPAVALNILRETVVGRELFDFAFKEYSRRWAFKRPYPADFFRTMEDATAKDLDWFWRGWFYTTDHVDMAITGVTHARITDGNPEETSAFKRKKFEEERKYIGETRNADMKGKRYVDRFPEMLDFYNEHDRFTITKGDEDKYARTMKGLKDWEKELVKYGHELYFIDFENIGGLVMPLVLQITFEDDTTEEVRIPAEIWRQNHKNATKLLIREKKIKDIVLDPHREIADADKSNNFWPARAKETQLELFKRQSRPDLMKRYNDGEKKRAKEAEEKAKKEAEAAEASEAAEG